MKIPVVDEAKLSEVMKIIDDADSIMTEEDCENDETAKAVQKAGNLVSCFLQPFLIDRVFQHSR